MKLNELFLGYKVLASGLVAAEETGVNLSVEEHEHLCFRARWRKGFRQQS